MKRSDSAPGDMPRLVFPLSRSLSNLSGVLRPSTSMHHAWSDPYLSKVLRQAEAIPNAEDSAKASLIDLPGRHRFEKTVKRYYYQLCHGCGNLDCTFKLCASSKYGPRLTPDAAAIMAVQLASRPKHLFCPRLPEDLPLALPLDGRLFSELVGGPLVSREQNCSGSLGRAEAVESSGRDPALAKWEDPRRRSRVASEPLLLSFAAPSAPQPKPFLLSILASSPFASIFASPADSHQPPLAGIDASLASLPAMTAGAPHSQPLGSTPTNAPPYPQESRSLLAPSDSRPSLTPPASAHRQGPHKASPPAVSTTLGARWQTLGDSVLSASPHAESLLSAVTQVTSPGTESRLTSSNPLSPTESERALIANNIRRVSKKQHREEVIRQVVLSSHPLEPPPPEPLDQGDASRQDSGSATTQASVPPLTSMPLNRLSSWALGWRTKSLMDLPSLFSAGLGLSRSPSFEVLARQESMLFVDSDIRRRTEESPHSRVHDSSRALFNERDVDSDLSFSLHAPALIDSAPDLESHSPAPPLVDSFAIHETSHALKPAIADDGNDQPLADSGTSSSYPGTHALPFLDVKLLKLSIGTYTGTVPSDSLDSPPHRNNAGDGALGSEGAIQEFGSGSGPTPVDVNAAFGDPDFLLTTLRHVFSSPKALSQSFLAPATLSDGRNATLSKNQSGLDLASLRASYALILALEPAELFSLTLVNALELLLVRLETLQNQSGKPFHPHVLRCLLALLECPLVLKKECEELRRKTVIVLGNLRERGRQTLGRWLRVYNEPDFARILGLFLQYLEHHFHPTNSKQEESVVYCVKVLSVLYHANESANPRIVPISSFYCDALCKRLNFKDEYKIWKKSQETRTVMVFSFFNYPFLLDPVAKTRILHIDAMVQMSLEFEDAFVNQALVVNAQRFLPDSQTVTTLEKSLKTLTNPYLVLEVRREFLIADTLEQVKRKEKDLKKPFKVKFIGGGEEGMDQGGVQKEFFMVLVSKLVDPQYGMFTYDAETRYVWLSNQSLESESHFELVGTVIGLALYNGVILGVNFPRLMYKKLLEEPHTMEDIKDAFPALGKGLESLLTWSDGDVADVFMRTFVIEYDMFGTLRRHELCDGGEDILVTNVNRAEFVRLYVDHLVNVSIARQFQAFRRGFWRVCGGQAIQMCRAEELELLVSGSANLDFSELERATQYDDGYSPTHPVIQAFWQVMHEYPLDLKKKVLMFVTASDRVPLKGLGHITFVIQRNGPDTDRLPSALTCFGRLLLPEYAGKDKLQSKLTTAIENGKGFGLV